MVGSTEARSEPRSDEDVLLLFVRERKLVTLIPPRFFLFSSSSLFFIMVHTCVKRKTRMEGFSGHGREEREGEKEGGARGGARGGGSGVINLSIAAA